MCLLAHSYLDKGARNQVNLPESQSIEVAKNLDNAESTLFDSVAKELANLILTNDWREFCGACCHCLFK